MPRHCYGLGFRASFVWLGCALESFRVLKCSGFGAVKGLCGFRTSDIHIYIYISLPAGLQTFFDSLVTCIPFFGFGALLVWLRC